MNAPTQRVCCSIPYPYRLVQPLSPLHMCTVCEEREGGRGTHSTQGSAPHTQLGLLIHSVCGVVLHTAAQCVCVSPPRARVSRSW